MKTILSKADFPEQEAARREKNTANKIEKGYW